MESRALTETDQWDIFTFTKKIIILSVLTELRQKLVQRSEIVWADQK